MLFRSVNSFTKPEVVVGGVLIRTKVKQIREMGRSTQGVTLINLDAGQKLSGLQQVVESDEEDES